MILLKSPIITISPTCFNLNRWENGNAMGPHMNILEIRKPVEVLFLDLELLILVKKV